MRPNEDPLDTAEALMAAEDKHASDPGFASVRQRRTQRIYDHRIALLIGLDIARSLRNIYYVFERMNP